MEAGVKSEGPPVHGNRGSDGYTRDVVGKALGVWRPAQHPGATRPLTPTS
jgi:hypothetical protein